jgi:hypothetical protein
MRFYIEDDALDAGADPLGEPIENVDHPTDHAATAPEKPDSESDDRRGLLLICEV